MLSHLSRIRFYSHSFFCQQLPHMSSPPRSRENHCYLFHSYHCCLFHSYAFWEGALQKGEGNGIPLQSSCLENPMDGGAWWAAVHGVARVLTQLSDFTFTFHFHALEKEMATRSSVPAWRTPGTAEPGGLSSMGSRRDGHDWSDLAAAAVAALEKGVATNSSIPA